ncbi:acylneuraminate cytidylyltransferase family protein [Shewanella chilikensis]|uniref:acylneuraminate cytidylyltransferase family protein n=1 Tax=Shewanella chilikensis TaxID=558541 RepID=UPI00200D84FC|nr:acylneuraminate cytidylyltransferase family protein [Shewanella chilikensis]MCL1160667.1 acylneuraminate cytidylyltransferase family protein [Shewanella chilikensis]
MERKFVALITARGGSKGLPRKNVLPVNGTPLIGLTINSAKQCDFISDVFVSTEDTEIAKISIEYGAKIIKRPDELATDTASSINVVSHAIQSLESDKISFSDMVLLQPTSPLRTSVHLNEALTQYIEKAASCVISVFEPAYTPVKSYIQAKDGTINGLYSDEAPYSRRQDLPKAYQPNGAIYAFSVVEFKKVNHFPRTNVYPYIMSVDDSADIDSIEDLKLVEKRLKELANGKPSI